MEIQTGYAYHVKDIYFNKAKDKCLMQNKEQGSYRPILYCVEDKENGILWMVPISSQYDKYEKIRKKILDKGKPCKGIVLGEYDGQRAVYLPQNMFPVTLEYLDHVHTKNGNPIPVKKELQKVVIKNVKSLLALNAKGLQVTFTDINKLKALMLHEIDENRID